MMVFQSALLTRLESMLASSHSAWRRGLLLGDLLEKVVLTFWSRFWYVNHEVIRSLRILVWAPAPVKTILPDDPGEIMKRRKCVSDNSSVCIGEEGEDRFFLVTQTAATRRRFGPATVHFKHFTALFQLLTNSSDEKLSNRLSVCFRCFPPSALGGILTFCRFFTPGNFQHLKQAAFADPLKRRSASKFV